MRPPKNMKQVLLNLNEETDANIIIVGDFNILLSSMDR
jgi:exonuclease III